MKLSIIICFTIATAGLILNIKHTNPYFDLKSLIILRLDSKNPYLISNDQRKSFAIFFKMMITKRPNPKIDEVKQLDLDSLSQKLKKR